MSSKNVYGKTVCGKPGLVLACLVIFCLFSFPALAQEEEPEKLEEERVYFLSKGGEVGSGTPFHFNWIGGGGFLGVESVALTPELRRHFGVGEEGGVMIGKVVAESPAAQAGLAVGDILTRVDGTTIASPHELMREIRKREENEPVTLEYWRDGRLEQTTAHVTVRERTVVDLSKGLHLEGLQALKGLEGLESLEGLKGLKMLEGMDFDFDFNFDPQMVTRMQTVVRERLEDPEFQAQMKRLEEIDVEDLERRIEERMKEVQERLEELELRVEKELDEHGDGTDL